MLSKIKQWGSEYKSDIILGIGIMFFSLASFGLGRLSVIWAPRETVSIPASEEAGVTGSPIIPVSTRQENLPPRGAANTTSDFIASKNGSVYHLSDCPGALKIKPENKITFKTETEAKAAGYKPAANCPGLQP
ncbi:MAG: hypothetical protein HY220_01205 [Candidatus Sungbacteria bacterium]|uniref:Ada DNA repair metal-binding domain-containing protein n=1 Tax=Candidatus Sungiibacteriota bacterium TaxID=2750080 RepID=A0A9D6QRU1_9BACT|nr:hypothetical protein [Candidatus Sungbacteria bacterium]